MKFITKTFILLFFLTQSISFSPLSIFLTEYSQKMHKICMSRISASSNYSDFHQALLCGENLPVSKMKDLLIKSSLYHLVVVSGSHLIFISSLVRWGVKKLPAPPLIQNGLWIVMLLLYCMMTLLQAPLVRALLAFLLQTISRYFKWNWNSVWILFYSVLLSLCIFPHWISSPSLLLSSLSSLALILSLRASSSMTFSLLLTHGLVYLAVLPLLGPSTEAHPIGILYNMILGPLFSMFLLPLSILNLLLPFLNPLTDFILNLFFFLLETGTHGVSFHPNFPWVQFQHWVYFFILWGLGLSFFIVYRRKKWSF